MLQLKFNPGLTLTAFRTTRPRWVNMQGKYCRNITHKYIILRPTENSARNFDVIFC